MVISLRTMKVHGEDWTLRTSSLPLRFEGESRPFLFDREAHDLLIGTRCSPSELVSRTADAMVILNCPQFPQGRCSQSHPEQCQSCPLAALPSVPSPA